jgi:hypothetical protein
VDARKERFGREDLREFFKDAGKVIAARGKKSIVFDMKQDPPSLDDLAQAVLGPSGNLRAPTLKLGKTYLVGFGDAAYADVFGQ